MVINEMMTNDLTEYLIKQQLFNNYQKEIQIFEERWRKSVSKLTQSIEIYNNIKVCINITKTNEKENLALKNEYECSSNEIINSSGNDNDTNKFIGEDKINNTEKEKLNFYIVESTLTNITELKPVVLKTNVSKKVEENMRYIEKLKSKRIKRENKLKLDDKTFSNQNVHEYAYKNYKKYKSLKNNEKSKWNETSLPEKVDKNLINENMNDVKNNRCILKQPSMDKSKLPIENDSNNKVRNTEKQKILTFYTKNNKKNVLKNKKNKIKKNDQILNDNKTKKYIRTEIIRSNNGIKKSAYNLIKIEDNNNRKDKKTKKNCQCNHCCYNRTKKELNTKYRKNIEQNLKNKLKTSNAESLLHYDRNNKKPRFSKYSMQEIAMYYLKQKLKIENKNYLKHNKPTTHKESKNNNRVGHLTERQINKRKIILSHTNKLQMNNDKDQFFKRESEIKNNKIKIINSKKPNKNINKKPRIYKKKTKLESNKTTHKKFDKLFLSPNKKQMKFISPYMKQTLNSKVNKIHLKLKKKLYKNKMVYINDDANGGLAHIPTTGPSNKVVNVPLQIYSQELDNYIKTLGSRYPQVETFHKINGHKLGGLYFLISSLIFRKESNISNFDYNMELNDHKLGKPVWLDPDPRPNGFGPLKPRPHATYRRTGRHRLAPQEYILFFGDPNINLYTVEAI